MRFSLQEIKKQVQRRGGELYVSLHFLRPGELHNEIERLLAYHEGHIGLTHRQFSIDEANACVSDYRLARCLVATLSAWYSWRQPDWNETLLRIGNDVPEQLDQARITSPIYLRLALFNYVNERYAGFLEGQIRAQVLQAFASLYHLSVADLEYLLALDSEQEAVLVRELPRPPSADEVATLYNQWAFEAALFNASEVHFEIDCNAFVEMQIVEKQSQMPVAGLGAVIKRLCYLARKLGVYYDLAYVPGSTSQRSAAEQRRHPGDGESILHLTLYGPQEMTGAPQQYGLRLARLCRMLLGYSAAQPQPSAPKASKQAKRGGLIGAIREAEATVHFLQRSYRFEMDANLLNLLPHPAGRDQSRTLSGGQVTYAPPGYNDTPAATSANSEPSVFDSSIEQNFAEAFTALAMSQGADGWQLEREPEPLLATMPAAEASSQSIFIPDFALTRGNRRIYVEILGFWTPSYRERKIAKLRQLRGRDDVVLAIPVEAREAFAAIAQDFPIAEYDGQLSATELLNLLRSRYDDFDERLARIDVERVRERVANEKLLPERACYELLQCYRRSELQRAANRIESDRIVFAPGVGLYMRDWLEHLRVSFVEWLGNATKSVHALPLSDVLHESRERWPVLASSEDAALEALIGLWPEVRVRRSTIFEATVGLVDRLEDNAEEMSFTMAQDTPKKVVRERRTTYKKRSAGDTIQGDLWG